ncbi:MAG: DUF1080 domain-containing protein [Planctomycetaceae bacterium]|nr:DUF1080 domain-containing protein [Planctomycetaceae bacterium]
MSHWRILIIVALALCSLSQPGLSADEINEPVGDAGFVPAGPEGRPLNLNFETGDLTDWTISGDAFTQQPIKGDIDQNRPYGKGRHSRHTGDFWLGGYETLRDTPTGTLTSVPFKVTQPWGSFLVAGGNHPQTRVELVRNDTNEVFYKISGTNREELAPTIVNLDKLMGKEIFIRVVDEHTGGWGHINFDDFRLHAKQPRFKEPVQQPANAIVTTEVYPYSGLSAEDAARVMQVPPGFSVQVAAAEPDVTQPIAMAFDDRGRLWIAEAHSYPVREAPGEGKDRILIFEDADLDGRFETRKVFIEGLNLVSGLEVGFGGVWVGAAPYLLFIPDKDGDDIPDAPAAPRSTEFNADVPNSATVLLDGWHDEDTHETLNAFIWGPDGWLYGCHGVFTHSRVGKPGTPDDQRIPLNAGIWRYHPTRHVFEVYAHGTSNPWGVDFNEYGDAFCTACVIPHLYHIIPGARYQRQAGQHFNPHTYDDIKTIARHRHFVGNQWNNNDRARSDDLGGGHAHAGAMIYLGGAWPREYDGKLFMNNIHGNRINVDQLIPEGSGYAGDRAPDFLLTGDKSSQMLYMTYGPDGQVYVIDWYDANQCHHRDDERHDRTNGRIYRISYNGAKPVRVDLQKLSTEELVRLAIESNNEWYVRHARRILQERAAQQSLGEGFTGLSNFPTTRSALRLLWVTHVTGEIRREIIASPARAAESHAAWLALDDPQLRSWSVRLFSENLDDTGDSSATVRAAFHNHLRDLAASTQHLSVRLAIASALQKQPVSQRWSILEALLTHAEDATDHNLPLMYWYAMEPLADADPQRALALAMSAGENFPMLREFMIRRLGSGNPADALSLLIKGLGDSTDDAVRMTFLRGIHGTLRGKKINTPAAWGPLYEKLTAPETTAQAFDVYMHTQGIGTLFGQDEAAQVLREVAIDESGPPDHRAVALGYLVEARDSDLPRVIGLLLQGTSLRSEAIRAAAIINDAAITESLIAAYKSFNDVERRDARNTLAGRAPSGIALLNAVESNRIPRADLSADLVRQLRNLNSDEVNGLLQRVWGVVRETSVDRQAQIARYKALIEDSKLPPADIELGRAIFSQTCQQCHTLFGTGGKVGPDITGANRRDVNYLLSNILDPSAVMAKEYQPLVVAMQDGRVITGILKEETASAITLQTTNELLTIPRSEIEDQRQSDKSMMPEDLLRPFSTHEVRALAAYLQSSGQVAMKGTPQTLAKFFNGTDLTGWRNSREADEGFWTVENGELVGRSPGLKHNAFLLSELSLDNFRFSCEVLLKDNVGNSGIQFRSEPLVNGEVRGYQADIGPGWWGKLYEEQGRGLLHDVESAVKAGEWNTYEIVAVGSRVRIFVNGILSVDRSDPAAARKGLIAFQLHSGGPMEVRFRNLNIELLTPQPPHAANGSAPGTFASSSGEAVEGSQINWKKATLNQVFRSEGVCIADFDNDGRMDVSGGSQIYPSSLLEQLLNAPDSGNHAHPIPVKVPPEEFDPKGYSNSFMNYAEDLNGDGYLDLIVVDFPGKQSWWFENPGAASAAGVEPVAWKRHEITPVTNNESPQYLDLNGDGRRELVCGIADKILAYLTPQTHPEALWKINPISLPGVAGTDKFSHGLGAGDLNGDGRPDILITAGWWEAPARNSDPTQPWMFHEQKFGPACSQMMVYDFDGDGDNDVLTASAHDFGIWWHENTAQPGEDPTFTQHEIDKSFSETHAVVLADINSDGLPDFVTGKRWWSHAGHGPGGDQPAVLHWFELKRDAGTASWVRHEIDTDSGVGTDLTVGDIDGDGLLDIAISNKKGTFVFQQQRPSAN